MALLRGSNKQIEPEAPPMTPTEELAALQAEAERTANEFARLNHRWFGAFYETTPARSAQEDAERRTPEYAARVNAWKEEAAAARVRADEAQGRVLAFLKTRGRELGDADDESPYSKSERQLEEAQLERLRGQLLKLGVFVPDRGAE